MTETTQVLKGCTGQSAGLQAGAGGIMRKKRTCGLQLSPCIERLETWAAGRQALVHMGRSGAKRNFEYACHYTS